MDVAGQKKKKKKKKTHFAPGTNRRGDRRGVVVVVVVVVPWLRTVPATCKCISGTDLAQTILRAATLRQKLQTFHLTRPQDTDTGPTSPSTDPITPSAWQGSHWDANFEVTCMSRPRKKSRRKRESNPGSSALEVDALITRPTRRCDRRGPLS